MNDWHSIVNCDSCGEPGIPADLTDGVCEDCLPEFREVQKDSEIKLLRHELARMLSWHDVVCDTAPEVVSPYHIQETRDALGASP